MEWADIIFSISVEMTLGSLVIYAKGWTLSLKEERSDYTLC